MNQAEQREEAIFEAALQLPTNQRAAYLDQVCEYDAELRRRVEALLGAFERAGGFMRQAAVPMPARPAAFSLPPTEKPGDKIGRYKLLEQIGEGGCGIVYVAEQEEPVRRRVALKVIKLGMDTKQVIARFDAERQALAMMDHPNIAKIFDAGICGQRSEVGDQRSEEGAAGSPTSDLRLLTSGSGRPYFVMELVRGIKITDYCDQNQLPPRERLDLFIQVCRAIQHAHQKGVIHRDIKPSNILVTVNDGVPVPKVIDFGIAKATQGRLTDQTIYTAFEQFIGTPAYMSPEQAVMTSLDIDTRSDIYSLGVLLYELLTGKTPFDAKELLAAGLDEMRRTIREVEPLKPSTRLTQELVADDVRRRAAKSGIESASSPRRLQELIHLLRGDLDWIVMKCLEKDRTRRYETANGLATDISRHLSNEPIVARPPSRLYRFQKSVQRNKLAFVAAAGFAVLVLLALVALSVSNVRVTKEKRQKEAALETARKSEQEAKAQLFLSLRSQAQARRFSRQMGQRFDSLAALAEAARIRPEESLRDEAIAALALPDIQRDPRPHFQFAGSKGIVFDNMYERYAAVDERGVVTVRTFPGNQEICRFDSQWTNVMSVAGRDLLFSPDGRFLATLENDHPCLYRLADGQSLLHNAPEKCSALVFSPDSRQLAISQGERILCFDPVKEQETQRWQAPRHVDSLAFHPDSRRLAVGHSSDSGEVSVYDSTEGRVLARLPVGSSPHVLAWHPDGRRLAVAGSDPRIQLWDVEARRKVATLVGHAQNVTVLTFHPDGALLASASWDGAVRLWDPASARQLMEIPFPIDARFSGDGRWLGFVWLSVRQPQFLELASGREYRTLVSNRGPGECYPYEGDISPDGRLLALGMEDGVRLWELANGRELAFLPLGDTQCALFEPDGSRLLTCGRDTGLQRTPVEVNQGVADELRLGPPNRVSLPFTAEKIARSQDGRLVAAISEHPGEGLIFDMQTEVARGSGLKHPLAGFVALSRDGRLMASSGWHSDKVRLWDAFSGKMIHEWPVPEALTAVAFTPDSRRLIICRQEDFTFWDVESLQLKQRLRREVLLYPGHVAFSPDGKLMAMEMAAGVVHLKEVATGRTVAKLEDPFHDRSAWMIFTPDGTQLVVEARYARVIHIWDLLAIRVRLKAMGLDWDWPEFPPAVTSSPPK